jgi:inhibitor of KinA sporulation pathway (predicted exonuclease)
MENNIIAFIDLEATCERDSRDIKKQEVIDIGIVWTDITGETPIGEVSALVKPSGYISEFCTELTGITQSDVNQAEPFEVVWPRLWEFVPEFKNWYSWGEFDNDLFKEEWHRSEITDQIWEGHVDLATLYKKVVGVKRGRRRALKFAGGKPYGNNHRGLSDAHDVRQIYKYLYKNEIIEK